MDVPLYTLPIIGKNGESQNGGYKIAKHAKFSKKIAISNHLIRTCTCEYQGVIKCLFFGKFGEAFFSCNNHFEIGPFALLSTIRVLFHKREFDDSIKRTCGNAETFGKINFEFYQIYFHK